VLGDVEALSRADASNLQLESADQVNVVIAAGTLGAGGFVGSDGSVDVAAAREWLGDRLAADPELRRLRQRIIGRRQPHWQSVPTDLTQHVRVVPDAGPSGLAELCSALMTVPLPPDQPLWELLLIPGAPEREASFIIRLHHSVADGTGGVRLFERLTGAVPDPPATPAPQPVPTTASAVHRRRRLGHSLVRISALLTARIGPTPLLGRISGRRSVAFASADLATISTAARRHGGTVNDALLTAVAGGVAAALTARDVPVPASVRASVPVALAERGGSGNATGVMVVDLPTAESDPTRRLASIATQTTTAKQQARAQGTFELTRSRWGTRIFWMLAHHQRFVALFVSNVKGPTQLLQLAGAPVSTLWPVTPIQGNIRLGVTAISYRDRLYCGVHADLAGLDATVLGAALQQTLDDLSA
jgi:hypothetical protein